MLAASVTTLALVLFSEGGRLFRKAQSPDDVAA
jgi:hypothetical protein